ncbi:hypothetical protein CO051_05570 [Candidatus Roizmanbacteria bacterium CG_4_9_14_0_2_um_filter_39_13]|uniref:LytR/CpsA/Psr regulator C-terminal domain-containing protein n=2 Tax=Candidatus Roizmaniibacteriota TaxID=1752723 RepID=A0A2M8EX49_9BACT|nr:MAG: hypothetical protein COY15_04780 [Candidatus Roizmanbacteria bacterium CG_4_10_14_0_2_um_filter_39_12]PJC30454.1 MAG: hypothetical protein CO051_05570 [Candidatus Roizmanbacteria bacterium CG_4_9_14_0_2_um_filter_39_13]PJE61654.1 MAG: hypothetical protein COU87_03390 [Candidatus Roizmanbacteria bacterium CG10_big_fil_rev_8_21_14_0_10_39_12]
MKKSYKKSTLYIILGSFLFFYATFKLFSAFSSSLFFSRPMRLNVVVYGPTTTYYSFDLKNNQNYNIRFDPEVKVDVPGAYGQYRIGSLGKLVQLEKNPDILKKAFSTTTTSFVQYYLYQKEDDIYYDAPEKSQIKPSLKSLILSSSNASFLDRVYLTGALMKVNDDFKKIQYRKEKNEALGDTLFQEDSFIKDSIGLLYNDEYREEHKSVQVLYRQNYKTARTISSLLEGNGIRVSDINRNTTINDCRIMISDEVPSQTAKDLSKYFFCPIVKGKTDVYDILFVLGDKEEEWKIN